MKYYAVKHERLLDTAKVVKLYTLCYSAVKVMDGLFNSSFLIMI